MSFLDALNSAQREAVTHGEGPLLVVAGAGSGKTRVLTHRVAWLLAEGLARPSEITAVTFTNKAAREMRERVDVLLGGGTWGVFLGTFHRWALDLLRRHPAAAGLPQRFSILDADDQAATMRRVVKELGLDEKTYPARKLLARISAATNQGRRPVDLAGAGSETLARTWERYTEVKRRAGAVDFDDMLVLALKLLNGDEAVRQEVMRRCRFLLVDEFQDTNRLQMELVKRALGGERSITAVGDEDQSIYRWRGAEVDNILSFEGHFPGASVVMLEQNYRSTAPILAAAAELIARNEGRRGKTLYTEREGGDPVRLFVASDDWEEARWVADRIQEALGRVEPGEVAVLMRTNAQTRPFEEELTRRGVAYRVVGGLRFWQRAVVKDALSYLRLVVHPDDETAFRRVVNVPARGIGAATLDVLERHARARELPLPAAARELPEDLSPRARRGLEEFFGILREARERRDDLSPGDLVGWLLERSGLLDPPDTLDPEKITRRENLLELAAGVEEAAAQGQNLDEFLDAVALLEEGDEAATADSVSLMTLHAAKGLEFDLVFLAGLEEGLLPHASASLDNDGREEERRLAYVGMTRARRWLVLTAAETRRLFGTTRRCELSSFLLDIPRELYEDLSFDRAPSGVRGEPVAMGGGGALSRAPARSDRPAPQRAGSRKNIRPTVTDGAGVGWRPGDRVRHARFGTGVVLSCQGTGPRLKLVVFFDRQGRKTLVPTIARLEKI